MSGDSSIQGEHVLVVEDDPLTRVALLKWLRNSGFQATGVSTVADAMEKLGDHPQFVLLDLMLPGRNGLAVLWHIRSSADPIRVAVLTGSHDSSLLDCASKFEPDLILSKPVDLPRLLAWLRRDRGSIAQASIAQG